MRNKLLIALLFIIVIIFLFPYRLTARKVNHYRFINFMVAQANVVNTDIKQQRQHLLKLYTSFEQHKSLTKTNLFWLAELAKQYKIKNENFKQASTWKTLSKRVDIIPTSLVVAQSINESAWGTSRFARQGHNYFGEWCYTAGCGLIPLRRAAKASFEVRKFASPLLSVQSYMRNLNTSSLYQAFRNKRYQLRNMNKRPTGLALVSTLTMYSTKRQTYVKIITNIINQYDLSRYDHEDIKG